MPDATTGGGEVMYAAVKSTRSSKSQLLEAVVENKF